MSLCSPGASCRGRFALPYFTLYEIIGYFFAQRPNGTLIILAPLRSWKHGKTASDKITIAWNDYSVKGICCRKLQIEISVSPARLLC